MLVVMINCGVLGWIIDCYGYLYVLVDLVID